MDCVVGGGSALLVGCSGDLHVLRGLAAQLQVGSVAYAAPIVLVDDFRFTHSLVHLLPG